MSASLTISCRKNPGPWSLASKSPFHSATANHGLSRSDWHSRVCVKNGWYARTSLQSRQMGCLHAGSVLQVSRIVSSPHALLIVLSAQVAGHCGCRNRAYRDLYWTVVLTVPVMLWCACLWDVHEMHDLWVLLEERASGHMTR